MSLHEYYLKDIKLGKNPALRSKPLGWTSQRIKEAQKITQKMNNRPFSFLRLGDMDLTLLLGCQDRLSYKTENSDGGVGGTKPYGNPGIDLRHAERFWKAFQNADYVDFHELLLINEQLLPQLKLNRSNKSFRNPTKETSYIFPTWVEREFTRYCQHQRVGFAGAEISLLRVLHQKNEYHRLAKNYWTDSCNLFFHQVRNNGRDLNKNLDLIKDDLRRFILDNKLNTLFLALGGGAKILCYELSQELNICAIDCGSMFRMLTYSGSDGNRATRSTHSPFLFRVPFNLYMNSLEEAMPDLMPAMLLAKAHAQLILEVQKKEVGWTHAAQEYDFSEQNLKHFKSSFKEYQKHYRKIFSVNEITQKERKDFLHFCGKNNLTLEGKIFYAFFRLKTILKDSYQAFTRLISSAS